MKFIHILVEGQTEETFIRDVLNPYLILKNIFLTPVIITTKIVPSGPNFKGGIKDYNKIKKDILNLLHDSSVVRVTTMIDYYGIPYDFPGYNDLPSTDCYRQITHLEKHFSLDIGSDRFLPYLSLHEFEAILFVSPEHFSNVFSSFDVDHLIKIRNYFKSPEEINQGETTHPSARIKNLIPTYRKRLHGPLISRKIGIDSIRNECKHFNQWIENLERLAQ